MSAAHGETVALQPTAYGGSARDLLPTASEAKYARRKAILRIRHPSPGKKSGFRDGWEAQYVDPGGSPQASLTVYVYQTGHGALAAYRDACAPAKGCSSVTVRSPSPSWPIKAKVVDSTTVNGVRCVGLVAASANVYTAVVTCAAGNYTFRELRFDAGYLIGFVYGRAAAL